MRICVIAGCERTVLARGWCGTHYARWRKHGITDDPYLPTPEERFWAKVDKSGDCWLWTGSTAGIAKYGKFWDGERLVPSHRFAYELLVGLIPDDKELDHRATCPKHCVNPAHLRPATTKQNSENVLGARSHSTSGVRGVRRSHSGNRWQARVTHNGQELHVGSFPTLEEAEAAVIAKRLELFTHNDLDRMTS